MGISHVRIGEFAWSFIEPSQGQYEWGWLDRAVETLHAQGLSVIMCTPTAAPPKWLVDANPDVLAVDAVGAKRQFGSRRHYCFSSQTFRQHSDRITRQVAQRYGTHPAVVAWQTDNEYGCHDTVISYSTSARNAFRTWLTARYATTAALNNAWGCAFWSQRYNSFAEVDPPVATVTEANPAQRLDWQRFASDQVVAFNRQQVAIIRELSPGRCVTHNFMGFFTAFDHYAVAADLDVASWDSYPLGFTQMFFLTNAEKTKWASTGHPDIAGFHHDLYRGMCNGVNAGRWWVMEQQPGPVNWAHWNPAPNDGMVRLWTWQAFAHGAELVSYFRWRQAPFGQEQMHAGLLRPDRSDDQGALEATQVNLDLQSLRSVTTLDNLSVRSMVALVFDYESLWMLQIQPQGADYNGLELCFRIYSALRLLGLDVDIVSTTAQLGDYRLVILPSILNVPAALLDQLQNSTAQIIIGPRGGSKTNNFQIPDNLAPGCLEAIAGISITRVASLPPGIIENILIKYSIETNEPSGSFSNSKLESKSLTVDKCAEQLQNDSHLFATKWREYLQLNEAKAEAVFEDNSVAISKNKSVRYVGAWLESESWSILIKRAAEEAGLQTTELPRDVRINKLGDLTLAFNFGNTAVAWEPDAVSDLILGEVTLQALSFSVWRKNR